MLALSTNILRSITAAILFGGLLPHHPRNQTKSKAYLDILIFQAFCDFCDFHLFQAFQSELDD